MVNLIGEKKNQERSTSKKHVD